MRAVRSFLLASLVGADGVALAALRPDLGPLAHRCAHLRDWFGSVGADRALGALAGAALWCAAVWLALGLVAAVASGLPGAAGRAARATCRLLLPATLRRLLAGSAGLSVLLAPALAGAHPAPHTSPRVGARLAAPVIPSVAAGRAARAPATPVTKRPDRTPPRTPRPSPRRLGTETVRVRSGDSLWLLAANRLGADPPDADVAAYWPRWYAANRAVIGTDPSLITPGEVLKIPAPTQQELS